MKYLKSKKLKVVCEDDPKVFEKEFNDFASLLDNIGVGYEIHYNDSHNSHCVYIEYETEKVIAETVKEQMRLLGEQHFCAECPLFEKPTDKRRKFVKCPHSTGITSAESDACDYFYEKLADGDAVLAESEVAQIED